MKILMFFAPAFIPVGCALIHEIKQKHPGATFVALATTKKVADKLKKDPSLNFEHIECLEDREKEWLQSDFHVDEMRAYEEKIGRKNIQNMIVCDRHVGAGFVSGALPIHSKLYKETRDPKKLKSYTLGMIHFADSFLDKHKPDCLLAYVVASGPMLAISILCQQKGIQFIRLQHTRVEDRTIWDTNIKGMLDPVWERFNAGDQLPQKMHEKAASWYIEYRNDNHDPDYMAVLKKQNKRAMSLPGISGGIIKAVARMALYDVVKGEKPLRSPSGFQGLLQAFSVPYKTWKTANMKGYVSLEDAKRREYIYFPLHVDPEASTMLLSPDFTNQATVIEAIAKNMPPHMDLLVKEHPNMNGRRPGRFYEKIKSFPNTHFLDPSITGAQALAHSKLLATITGTAGWEAVLNKKKGIIFGDTHFRRFPCLVHCRNLANLSDDINEALTKEPFDDRELIRFIGLLFDESFSLPSSVLWCSEELNLKDDPTVQKLATRFLNIISTPS